MQVSSRTSRSPGLCAGLFVFVNGFILRELRFFARPAAAVVPAFCGKLKEVLAAPFSGLLSTFLTQYGGCRESILLKEVVYEGQR